MIFISRYRNYIVPAVKPTTTLVMGTSGPREQIIDRGVICHFRWGGLATWEIEEARKVFKFDGVPDGVDPLKNRLSWYDTDMEAEANRWDEKTKKAVEEGLLARVGADMVRVIKPPSPKPWPNYDRVKSSEKIIQKVKEDGYDPQLVMDYEKENLNRQEIIDAMKELKDAQANAKAKPTPIQIEVSV